MNKNFLTKTAVAAIAIAALSGAQSARAADTNTTLEIQNFTSVTSSANVTLTPTIDEIQSGSKDIVGAITLDVVTNNATGCKVTVSAGAGNSRATLIDPADIELKSADEGAVGTFGGFTALSTTAADLWNTTGAIPDGQAVSVDVRFKNLKSYPAAAGATKNYSNVITFTAVANS